MEVKGNLQYIYSKKLIQPSREMGTQHLNTFVMNLIQEINQTQNASKDARQVKVNVYADNIRTLLGELFPDCNVPVVHVGTGTGTLHTVAFVFQEVGRSEVCYVHNSM